jgi:hypothetical protein
MLKALREKGFATAAEKAAVKTELATLKSEEQDAVSDEVAAVDAMPETNPAEKAEEDAAVKSILQSIDAKVADKVKAAKDEMNAEMRSFLENRKVEKNTKTIDALLTDEGVTAFVGDVKSKAKAATVIELKDFDFRAKASVAGDMSIADDYTGTRALAELEAGVSRSPQRQPFIEQLVTVGTISAPIDTWIEVTNEAGDPLPVAELAELSQKELDFAEKTAAVKKVGVFAKYSREMANDLPNLVSEIRNYLVADLRRVVDTQILSGNGTGDNLTGILQNATTYSAGAFAGTVLEANRFDVIETAVSQVITALHTPTHVVVNPTDHAKMNLSKGTDGHYVMPPFITASGQVVSGVRVVSNTGITAGTFLVGDFSRSSVKYREGLTIEMTNTDQDDFVKDRFTVRAIVRLVHRVKENDYGAFVKGSFATAIAALDLAS